MQKSRFLPSHIKHSARILQSQLRRGFVAPASLHSLPPVAVRRSVRGVAWHSWRHENAPNGFRNAHTAAVTDGKHADPARQLYDLSLNLSHTPMNGNAEMEYTLYDGAGDVVSTNNKLTKLDTASKYGLGTRDLRTIDLPFHGFPRILIRESTLIIYMFSLRLLVQADQTLLFHVREAGENREDNMLRLFRHTLEGKLHAGHGVGTPAKLPYELCVLEASLTAVSSTLEAEYVLAKRQAVKALEILDVQVLDKQESLIHEQLRKLLDLMRNLAAIEQRARHTRDAIQEVLNDDEDMADMHLTDKRAGKPHAVQDHQDVEYLLEAYFKSNDAIVQKTASLMADIKRTDETIQSSLNVRRNQIMVLEAKIEIIMVGMASATLVAGLYGMNVINYFEDSVWAFGALASICFFGSVFVWRFGLRQLKQIQKGHI